MNNTVIIAVIAVLGASVLLYIPFHFFYAKKKRAASAFIEQALQTGAVVSLFCDSATVNGTPLALGDLPLGSDGQRLLSLPAGTHAFTATFSISDPGVARTVNYTSKPVSFDLVLEQGRRYRLGMYDSPGESNVVVSVPLVADNGKKKYVECEYEK